MSDIDNRLLFRRWCERAQVVEDDEAERCDFVACSRTGFFPDDVHTRCQDCGTAIVHRPSAPKTPPKLCLPCLAKRVEQLE